jgi:hypothetical protein
MHAPSRSNNRLTAVIALVLMVGLTSGLISCGSGGTGWESVTGPYPRVDGSTGGTDTGPGNTGTTSGGVQGAGSRSSSDPCTETLNRKFVTISMRNFARDYIHYFFIAIAFVDVDETDSSVFVPGLDNRAFPDGAVCPDDIGLYTQQGYQFVGSGDVREVGDYCIVGPALYYFHQNGNFRVAAGTSDAGLGSGIAPAQGQLPSFDNFFTSAGAQLPVPDLIIFHNPGAGRGATLKVSTPVPQPCSFAGVLGSEGGAPPCSRDSFYYVTFDDIMVGSRALGIDSGRRVPSDIQGTGCECAGSSEAYQLLAPSGARASSAQCNEFFRGGRIDYAFFQADTTPAFPQLVWRVTDSTGAVAHEFHELSPLAGSN